MALDRTGIVQNTAKVARIAAAYVGLFIAASLIAFFAGGDLPGARILGFLNGPAILAAVFTGIVWGIFWLIGWVDPAPDRFRRLSSRYLAAEALLTGAKRAGIAAAIGLAVFVVCAFASQIFGRGDRITALTLTGFVVFALGGASALLLWAAGGARAARGDTRAMMRGLSRTLRKGAVVALLLIPAVSVLWILGAWLDLPPGKQLMIVVMAPIAVGVCALGSGAVAAVQGGLSWAVGRQSAR